MKRLAAFHRHSRPQRGVTLIEALVALVVMSFGMVALVGLLANLRYSGDLAKQRSEAMRLAQEELGTARAFSVPAKPSAAASNIRDYELDLPLGATSRTLTAENSNTTFTISRNVTALVPGVTLASGETEPQTLRAKTVSVTVQWLDRSGVQQTLTLDGIVSRTDPVFAAALGVTPPANGIRPTDNRNPVIPPAAKDLGNGSSAFRPSSGSSTMWLFNNLTGVITGKCELPEGTALSAVTPAMVESCSNNTIGYLVSGVIRFSLVDTPRPDAPEASVRPLSVLMNLTLSQYKERNREGVEVFSPGRDYPITPNHVCFTDAPLSLQVSQPLANYYCIVHPNTQTPPNWWGEVLLGGFDIGTASTQFKVCRYSADYNGNGVIDNEEHPAAYRGVTYSLGQQNFLVVRGNVGCPTLPRDTSVGRFVDYSTQQIQPALAP